MRCTHVGNNSSFQDSYKSNETTNNWDTYIGWNNWGVKRESLMNKVQGFGLSDKTRSKTE